MAKSTITITFTGVPAVNDKLSFLNSLAPTTGDIVETFVNVRQNNFQSVIGGSNFIAAANYYNALVLDYGNSGLYTFAISGNVVIITATVSNTVFSSGTFVGTSWRTIVYDNQIEETPIIIQSVVFKKYLPNICGQVEVEVTTNFLATEYSINGVPTVNALNPFSYIANRETSHSLEVEGANATTDSMTVSTPSVLISSNIIIDMINTPNGATLTITLFNDFGLELEFSLDNTIWQANNIFSGLAPGTYTVYVRDQFDCSTSTEKVVPVFSPDLTTSCPVSYISESMSIRFKHNVEFDDTDVFKNDFNTLSCEEDVLVPFTYRQMFRPSNMVTTQFLSNYANIIVNVIREDGSKVNIPTKLVYKFVDLKDKRDAQLKSLSPTKDGIYYTVGNVYEYGTNNVIGNYALNGGLPDYASVGNYVRIDEVTWYTILDIIYDEVVNADMLVIEHSLGQNPGPIKVSSNWNQKSYNVIEFDIDFAPFIDEYIQVEILQTSPGFEPFNYLSEVIEVRQSFKDVKELIWFNYEDSNVFYSTGIKNIGNIPFTSFNSANDSEVIINKTTNTSVMVSASNYDTKELITADLSTGVMKQVVQASLHKGFMVNKVPFIAASTPTVETVDNTNLNIVTMSLVQTNPPFLACSPGAPAPTLIPTPAVGNSPS